MSLRRTDRGSGGVTVVITTIILKTQVTVGTMGSPIGMVFVTGVTKPIHQRIPMVTSLPPIDIATLIHR